MPAMLPLFRMHLDAWLYPLRWASESVALRIGRSETVEGLVVVDVTHDATSEHIGRIRGALTLIREIDPRRYRRAIMDLRHILLVPRGGGAFYPATRTGTLRLSLVGRGAAPSLMLPLIALAARARLGRHGAPVSPTRGHAHRIELAVVREQERFRARLSPERFTELDQVDAYLRALRERTTSPS